MNHLNIIRLLDYRFYIDIINSNSLKDTIVPGSKKVWKQQTNYINATSTNVYNIYYSLDYDDTDYKLAYKDDLNYTESTRYSSASLRPSITFLE